MKRSFFTSRRLLLGTVLLLIVSSLLNARIASWYTHAPYGVVAALLVPLQRPFTWISQKLRPHRRRSPDPGDPEQLARQYLEAKAYNTRLWLQLQWAHEKIAQLKAIEHVQSVQGHKEVGADVIGVSRNPGNPTITIDCGERDGVYAGCAVVGSFSFVGRIVRAWPRRSMVQLIMSPQTQFQVAVMPPSAGKPPRHFETRLIWNSSERGFTAVVGRDRTVEVGDLAHLADIGYPPGAHGYVVGAVDKVEDYESNPLLFRKLTVHPTESLFHMKHVVVLVPVGE